LLFRSPVVPAGYGPSKADYAGNNKQQYCGDRVGEIHNWPGFISILSRRLVAVFLEASPSRSGLVVADTIGHQGGIYTPVD
jgi:hypothetical protein